MITVHALNTIPEVAPGDDLAALLRDALAGASFERFDRDILVVTQKIVSKAEDRYVDLATIVPGRAAQDLAEVTRKDPRLVELVLAESSDVIRAVPHVLITRHRTGHVMANAGIDQSNLGPRGQDGRGAWALLLPQDPDASAARLCEALGMAIIISDSFGRPWRMGITNVAIGAAGLPALVDWRGETDRDGRTLEVTEIAFADQIASAAGLVMGEAAEGVPAALVMGLDWEARPRPAADLIRPAAQDLFK